VAAAPSPAARADTNGGERTRERILDAALRLFAEHSFAGTSLQMIADELGITKAAVYYYFHTREELLGALAEPALTEMRAVIEAAAAQRTPNARAEQMLTRFVDLALRHRQLTAMLAADQAIVHLFRARGHYAELVERPLALLAGGTPGPGGSTRCWRSPASPARPAASWSAIWTTTRCAGTWSTPAAGSSACAPRAPKALFRHSRDDGRRCRP
jgi:AcrR family transcriptional regulator